MARVKSLLIRVEVDEAQRSHKCQASARHVLAKGDIRLKVRNGRSWDHYCLECARKIMATNLAALTRVSEALEAREAAAAGEDEEALS